MTDVLVLQPGFPAEVPFYVRGLAQAGARVVGIGDQPADSLPLVAREALSDYLQVPDLWDARAVIAALRRWPSARRVERVECLWEVAMELAADIREAVGLPGLDPDQTRCFRDKHVMRERLERAGIRGPRHGKARSLAELFTVVERVGFPLIIKPICGAGAQHTYRLDGAEALGAVLPALAHVGEVVVEEFVVGSEFTFDAISVDGQIRFHSVLRYTPTMLESRSTEWISPQNMVLRDLDRSELRGAYALGQAVLSALGFQTGFTHMEWFLTPGGEPVFCEIAARPPGGLTGELMNYCCDFDVYRAWGNALLHGGIGGPVERRYNVAAIFKRAEGRGRIVKIEGLDELYRRFGPHVMRHDLLPLGSPRRDWRQTLISDGFVMLRHPDLDSATQMSAWVAENLRLYAG